MSVSRKSNSKKRVRLDSPTTSSRRNKLPRFPSWLQSNKKPESNDLSFFRLDEDEEEDADEEEDDDEEEDEDDDEVKEQTNADADDEEKESLDDLAHRFGDLNICLSLGVKSFEIKKGVDSFTDFWLVNVQNIERIDFLTGNGFILQIPFDVYDQTAKVYAVLKSTQFQRADSLWYEYIVGKEFVNRYVSKLPCFIETYDLYRYIDHHSYKLAKQGQLHGVDNLTDILQHQSNSILDFKEACRDNVLICVMTQYVSHSVDMTTKFRHLFNYASNTVDLYHPDAFYALTSLYQVYFALNALKGLYTHYDLHPGNILISDIYPNDPDKYILMRFVYENGQVFEFKTKYLAKIIDYGRSFFYVSPAVNSEELINNICQAKEECGHDCGKEYGFIRPTINMGINPSKSNFSRDLVAAASYVKFFIGHSFAESINCGFQWLRPPIDSPPGFVNNVSDLLRQFEGELDNFRNKFEPSLFHNQHSAVLTVYQDKRPFEFHET